MTVRDRMIDYGLQALTVESDRVFLCSSDPATYANAIASHVGQKVGVRGSMFYAISSSPQGGRLASLTGFNDGDITANGTANYVVVADSVNQNILISELLVDAREVVSGAKFAINTFDVIFGASSQPQASNLTVASPVIDSPLFLKTPPIAQNLIVGSPSIISPTLIATGSTGWTNISTSTEVGIFICEYDAVPSALAIDNVIGMSNGPATDYPNVACIVLFNSNSIIQVRNGSTYTANSVMSYVAGTSYHVRMIINIPTHTYSVWVTPFGSSEVQLADDYAFRSDQATVSVLNNFARNSTDVGIVLISNLYVADQLTPTSFVIDSPLLGTPILNGKAAFVANNLTVLSPTLSGPSIGVPIVHGQTISLFNTGRPGASAAGIANYSSTLTTLSGARNYSTTQTVRNILFEGPVSVTGGTVTFEFCRFTYQPGVGEYAFRVYNSGSLCSATLNWCDFDTGLRNTQGIYETTGVQAGERQTTNPITTGSFMNVFRCSIQGYSNGIGYHRWRSTGSSVTECYIANLTIGDGNHADGIEIYSSDNITVQRSRIILGVTSSGAGSSQSTLNICPAFGNSTGNPIVIDSNYLTGGISPVLTRWFNNGGTQQRNVRYTNNYFGDASIFGFECDFNSMNVTFNLSFAISNPDVIYWASSNVWAPNGEGLSQQAGSAGLPHTAGSFVDQRNFWSAENGAWNGLVVGGPITLTANSLIVLNPVIGKGTLNGKLGLVAVGKTTASPVIGAPVFTPSGTGDSWSAIDGSLNAPTGAAQFPNLLSGYPVRPPWKVPGVDYRVGIQTGVVLQPITAINNPNVNVEASTGLVRCSGSNYVIDGYDFTDWTLYLECQNVTIRNCRNIRCGGYAIYMVGQSTGQWHPANITVEYCELTSVALSLDDLWSFLHLNGSGPVLVQYCDMHHSGGHIYEVQLDSAGTPTSMLRYNLLREIGCGDPTDHVNYTQTWGGASGAKNDYMFNTFVHHRQKAGGQMLQIDGTNGVIGNNVILTIDAPDPNPPAPFTQGTQGITVCFDVGSAGAFFQNITVRDNYIDPSLTYASGFNVFYQPSGSSVQTHVSGNVDLRNGNILGNTS